MNREPYIAGETPYLRCPAPAGTEGASRDAGSPSNDAIDGFDSGLEAAASLGTARLLGLRTLWRP